MAHYRKSALEGLMRSKLLVAWLCLTVLLSPVMVATTWADKSGSAYWSNLVHQENSITASLLYIPYIVFLVPVRVIEGIIDPKPTSQSTVPPPAHKISH